MNSHYTVSYINFQAKPGYLPKDILSPRWIFEYELASPVEDIGSESAIKIDMYGTFGDVITEEIKIQKSDGKIVLEHSNRYRVQYNLEDVGLAVFKAWRYILITNDSYRSGLFCTILDL